MDALFTIYRKLFARPVFHQFNKLLFLLSVRGLGLLNFGDDQASGEWHMVTRFLPTRVRSRPPTFVDVGANRGNYSALLLSAFPDAVIHAFEPHPDSYSRLQARFGSGSVTCHQTALGEAPGTVKLYDHQDATGSEHASVHSEVFSEIYKHAHTGRDVQIETLDDVAAREGVTRIDFLKIDTEGHELAVLQGARQLLESGRIECIQLEFNELNVISRVFFRDFRKQLPGFDFYRLLPSGLLPLSDKPLQTELFGYQNILAVRRNHAAQPVDSARR